jgi:hypothetical protein
MHQGWGGIVAGLLVILGGASLAGCHADATSGGVCQHPCDLAQTVTVQIKGSRPAASISTAAPCSGGLKCGAGGCSSAQISLANGSLAATADGAPDLVCTVTAVSVDGATATGQVRASYTAASCCSGYEFSSATLSLSFAPADAASD